MELGYINYIDDFLVHPEAIKEYLLKRNDFKYTEQKGRYFFTGKELYPSELNIMGFMQQIALKCKNDIAFIAPYQGWVRSLTKEEYDNKILHVHYDSMGISGVLCLNEAYEGGMTSFYQHNETGLTNVNDAKRLKIEADSRGISFEEMKTKLLKDGENMENWTKVKEIPYKFNRLILFDTNIFHLAGMGKGDTVSESKLAMQFQFFFMKDTWKNRRKNRSLTFIKHSS